MYPADPDTNRGPPRLEFDTLSQEKKTTLPRPQPQGDPQV